MLKKILFLGILFFLSLDVNAKELKDIKNLKDLEEEGYLKRPSSMLTIDSEDYNKTTTEIVQNIIYQLIKTILFLVGTVSVLMIVYAGFVYIWPDNFRFNFMQDPKEIVLYAVLGLILVLLSYAITENYLKLIYDSDQGEDRTYQIENNSYNQID
jgi:lysylphosphatidylglycerol synthetase-like protein (DUF2156 family)